MNKSFHYHTLASIYLLLVCTTSQGSQLNNNLLTKNENIHIAVASNFLSTAKQLKSLFEKETQHSITLISASTGQLTHQILNDAPFSVFLSANKQHPNIIKSKLNLPNKNMFKYAEGSLVLITHKPIKQFPNLSLTYKGAAKIYAQMEKDVINQILMSSGKIAMANDKLAPYGRATTEVLTALNLFDVVKSKTIKGQNIAQTHQFFTSKSVDSAFIAKSQLTSTELNKGFVNVSTQWHQPIEQWGLVITESPAAQAFVQFLSHPSAQSIIQNNGYGTPN